jgi:hypothetical protein
MAEQELIRVGKSGTERIISEKRQEVALLQPYEPFPKQQVFHNSISKYRLFGGAAGPGKSWALLMEAVDLAANVHAGINTMVLRRTFPELEASIILNFRRLVPPEAYKSYNTQKQIVTWHNGSVTKFGYCKTDDDVWQYQGGEWAFVGWDELTQFTLAQWTTLTGWNRSPHMSGRMAGATNPVGPGFGWVKAMWLDKKPPTGMDEGQAAAYNPDDYEFIPALLSDNPVYANDEDYKAKLAALPNHLRAALLEGRWDVLGGVYFDIFDRATMTCRPEEMGMKPWWPRWVSVDWGYIHPSAVYWHCQSDSGTTFTYRELVKDKLTPEDLAYEIVKRSGDQEKEKIQTVYLAPDAFARRQGPDTIADQMNMIFREGKFPIARMANNDRVGGAMLMYQMMRDGRWMIGSHCKHIIECIPMMIRDDKNVEDVMKIDGDDPYDSCRYGLKSRYAPKAEPFENRLRKMVKPIEDPNEAMMTVMRETAKNKKRSQLKRRMPRRFLRHRKGKSPPTIG